MKLSELQARQGKVEVEVTVVSVDPARTFNKFGKEGRVANAKISDDSGTMTLTLWNEQVDQVKVGDVILIHNGWVSEFKGELQLGTGKFGALEVKSSGGAVPAAAPAAKESAPSHGSGHAHHHRPPTGEPLVSKPEGHMGAPKHQSHSRPEYDDDAGPEVVEESVSEEVVDD